ncbi:hypothetical protein U3516DRAFT_737915 [Neocallimastix sp. 'constans']
MSNCPGYKAYKKDNQHLKRRQALYFSIIDEITENKEEEDILSSKDDTYTKQEIECSDEVSHDFVEEIFQAYLNPKSLCLFDTASYREFSTIAGKAKATKKALDRLRESNNESFINAVPEYTYFLVIKNGTFLSSNEETMLESYIQEGWIETCCSLIDTYIITFRLKKKKLCDIAQNQIPNLRNQYIICLVLRFAYNKISIY